MPRNQRTIDNSLSSKGLYQQTSWWTRTLHVFVQSQFFLPSNRMSWIKSNLKTTPDSKRYFGVGEGRGGRGGLEPLLIECRRTETKVNQSKRKVTTCSWRKPRENVCERVTIGFGFTSDWMKNWRESFKSITQRGTWKTNYFLTLKWKPPLRKLLWFWIYYDLRLAE